MFQFTHIATFYRLQSRAHVGCQWCADCRERAMVYDWLSSRQSRKMSLAELSFTLAAITDMN